MSVRGGTRPGLALVALLLATTPQPSRAEWTVVKEDAEAVIYRDYTTIEKAGRFRRVWLLTDFRRPGPRGIRSMRALEEFDCAGRRWHLLSSTLYTEPMGRGDVLAAEELSTRWFPLQPERADTLLHGAVLERICR